MFAYGDTQYHKLRCLAHRWINTSQKASSTLSYSVDCLSVGSRYLSERPSEDKEFHTP